MTLLVLGLVLFLGIHSARVFADGWRTAVIARIGEGPWKGLYSLVSIAGFVLLVWGYVRARQQMPLWDPPQFTRYVTAALMLPALVLFAAAQVPRNGIKARVHHPQLLSVKAWSLAHLVSNGNLADALLFGGFLAWSVLAYTASRKRDRAQGTAYPAGTPQRTVVAVAAGLALYALFVLGFHQWWLGVPPF